MEAAFTLTSALSLASLAAVAVLSSVCANALLPKNTRWQDKYTFIWMVSSVCSFRGPASNDYRQGL